MDNYGSHIGLPEAPDYTLFQRPDAGDESLFVVFYMGVIRNEAKSVEQGRPIYDDVECVRIIVPGDKTNVVDRPASDNDKRRFHKQYGMFKAGLKEEDQISGTRLTDWPFLTRGQCEEFRHLGLRTVEQLAEVRDDACTRVPGMRQLKDHAKVWLAKSQNTAEAAKQAQQMEDQKVRIDSLEEVVRQQASRIEALLAANKAAV